MIRGVATGTLIGCFLSVAVWIAHDRSDWDSYTTPVGGYERVTLTDGSTVQLNTNTQVRTRMGLERREIALVRGEVLVRIAADTRRSFDLKAGGTALRVATSKTETLVDIRLRAPKTIDVAVTEGNLAVASRYRWIDVALGRMLPADSMLSAGDTALVRPGGLYLARRAVEDLNRKLTWTAGLLSFQGETLTEVTDEFNRYNRRQLVVMDPGIATRRIGGAFQATDPDSFVAGLQKWFGIRADEQDPTGFGASVVELRGGRQTARR